MSDILSQCFKSESFDGDRTKYHTFRDGIMMMYLQSDAATYQEFPDDKSKILFVLYHTRESAMYWAKDYISAHRGPNGLEFGTFSDFLHDLDHAFTDPHFKEKARLELRTLRQGKTRVRDFCDHFELTRRYAGYEAEDHDEFMIMLLSQALNRDLVRRIHIAIDLTEVPVTFGFWKEKAIRFDDDRRWEVTRRKGADTSYGGYGEPMGIAEMRRRGLCFTCRERGHLARSVVKGRAGLGWALEAWAGLEQVQARKFTSPSPEPKPYKAQAGLRLKPGLIPHNTFLPIRTH